MVRLSKIFQLLIPLIICLVISILFPLKNENIQTILLCGILAIPIIFNTTYLNFALILALVPIDSILAKSTGQSILSYIILIVIIRDFIIKGDFIISKKLLLSYLIFLFWEFLHIYYYSYYNLEGNSIYILNFKLFITILYITFLSGKRDSFDTFEYSLLIFAISAIFSFIYSALNEFNSNTLSNVGEIFSGNMRVGGFGFNVNRFAGVAIIIVSSISLAMRRKRINPFILYIIFIVFCIIGLLSGSRSFLLSFTLLILTLLFVLPFNKENRTIKYLTVIFLSLFLFFFFSYYFFFENLIESINSRISAERLMGITRGDIFNFYFIQLISDPSIFLFGRGIYSYPYILSDGSSPHNLILEPFLAWGFIGTVLLINFLKQIILNCSLTSNENRYSMLTLLPVGFYIVQSLVSSVWSEPYFYMMLFFCFQIIYTNQNPLPGG